MTSRPDISVIIVHYNAPDDLARCLRSLAKASDHAKAEVIVVDNASSEDIAPLEKEFKKVHFIRSEKNVGWGAAINLAAETARGAVLLFLNPDAEIFPGSLGMLHKFFEAHAADRLGPVGGKLLYSNGEPQPSCGPFPHLGNLLWRMLLPKPQRRYYVRKWNFPRAVDWVTGAFLAVRRPVFDELGGLDPKFFLYYDDVDFCLRAREKGYGTYFLPDAAAYHHRPYAIRPPDAALKKIIQQSRLYYFKKHRSALERALLALIQKFER